MTQDELDAILKETQKCIERMQRLAAETHILLKDRERLQETVLGQAFTDQRAALLMPDTKPRSS